MPVCRKAFPKQRPAATLSAKMPDTVKFLLVVAVIGAALYGGLWTLAHVPPEQTEIVKPLPSEKLRAR
jgi:hypothetical protein